MRAGLQGAEVRIDGSAFSKFRFCGLAYRERYEEVHPSACAMQFVPETALLNAGGPIPPEAHTPHDHGGEPRGLVSVAPTPDRDFGTRFHQLVANHRRQQARNAGGDPELFREVQYPEWPDEDIELECQAVWAQYQAHYVGDALRILSVERTETLAIPGTEHELTVRIDAVVRHADGTIGPLDTKTESKPGYNFREDWAGRTQASLYLWALTQLYPKERVSRLVVDVVTRGTARRGPTFYRLDDISRPQESLDEAIRNVIWVCEDIEESRRTGFWRSNMNICKQGWKRCDYYDLHVYGRTLENLAKFKPAEAYLDV